MAALVAPVLKALPRVEQLSPRVIRVLGLNPGKYTLQGTNTYIVGTGKQRILIDTGETDRPDYVELLRTALDQSRAALAHILLTHWHLDHTGGVLGVRNMLAAGEGGAVKVSKFPLPPNYPNTTPISEQMKTVLPEDHTHLEDGTRITVEGATLVVMATPGHTPDHMSLLLEEENAVFSGDCILGQGSASFESLLPYLSSLRRLLSLSPSLIYPGHGPVVSSAVDLIQQYIQHREERETQVLAQMSKAGHPCTVAQLVDNLYPDLHPELVPGASNNVRNHLQKLEEENRIQRIVSAENDEEWTLCISETKSTL